MPVFCPFCFQSTRFAQTSPLTQQAANQDGAGPHSELVTCRTPAAAPSAVPSLFLQECPPTDADLYPPSTCLPLAWEEPCCNGAEITSYSVVMGDQSFAVGNVACYVVTDLQPNTEYRCVEFWSACAWQRMLSYLSDPIQEAS